MIQQTNPTVADTGNASEPQSTVSINVAFLREIKEDNVHFDELLEAINMSLDSSREVRVRVLAELLGRLRDELETHFALEEFYGYFSDAAPRNPQVSSEAAKLCAEHEKLFLVLNELVEEAEQLLYKETSCRSKNEIISGFHQFYEDLKRHEHHEMELMMRLWNEDIGVGD
jgi:hemerythrin